MSAISDLGIDTRSLFDREDPERDLPPARQLPQPPVYSPALPAPYKHPSLILYDLVERNNDLFTQELPFIEEEINQAQETIRKTSEEQRELIIQSAEATNSVNTWKGLSTVARHISSASTLIMATSCGLSWVTACLVGGTLAGLLNNTDLIQAGARWYTQSAELQESITKKIQTGLTALQIGLSVTGGIGAISRGLFSASQINSTSIKNNLVSVISFTSQTVHTFAQIGQSYSDKRLAQLMKKMKDFDATKTLAGQDTHDLVEKIQRTTEVQTTAVETATQSISSLVVPQH